MVDGSGLENRRTRKGTGGSNPSLSARTLVIWHLQAGDTYTESMGYTFSGCPAQEQCMAEWRDIAGYDGVYQVSDQGQVRNTQTRKLMQPVRMKNGRGLHTLLLGRTFYAVYHSTRLEGQKLRTTVRGEAARSTIRTFLDK